MATHAIRNTPDASIAYSQRVEDVIAALGSDAQQGLTSEEAAARLAGVGRNELATEPPIPAWRRFLSQFQDVLVILLLIATAVSAGLWVYEREAALPYEAIAILAVVVLNATLGYIQESKAEAAVTAPIVSAVNAGPLSACAQEPASSRADSAWYSALGLNIKRTGMDQGPAGFSIDR